MCVDIFAVWGLDFYQQLCQRAASSAYITATAPQWLSVGLQRLQRYTFISTIDMKEILRTPTYLGVSIELTYYA